MKFGGIHSSLVRRLGAPNQESRTTLITLSEADSSNRMYVLPDT